jgi:hypothetical protein
VLDRRKRDAPGIELGGVGLMPRTGEDVDFLPPLHLGESDMFQDPVPLCIQQSTGDSAGPEVDIVLGVLRDLLVHDDVGSGLPA